MILSRPQVLTIGYFTTDLLVKVDRFADIDDEVPIQTFGEYQGGSAANTAVGVRRLGVPAALFTCVGDDELARKGLRILASEDVDISRVVTSRKGLGSPYVVGIVDPQGERQLYSYGGAAQELAPDQLTHEDLADLVGASRQKVTEHMKELERQQLLVRDGRKLIVLPQRLQELISQEVSK